MGQIGIRGSSPKNGFYLEGQTRPKRHGILKTTFGLKLGEPVEREREEQRREEEEKKKKKGRSSSKAPKRYGTLDFWYGNYFEV